MPAKKRKPKHSRQRKLPRGGKTKASDILGGISAGLLGASTLGFDAPITIPLAGLTGLASGILKLFGAGGISATQVRALRRAQRQGLVLAKVKKPIRRKRR